MGDDMDDKSIELGLGSGEDLNALGGGVDDSRNVDGDSLDDDCGSLGAGPEEDGVSSGEDGSVGVDLSDLH